MKTYTVLLFEYKQAIRMAIEEYQTRFSPNNPMEEHRANDIAELEEILQEERQSEILKSRLSKALDEFKTGVLFIKTGRSKLKKAIQQQLEQPGFSEHDFLVARIHELEVENKKMQRRGIAPSDGTLLMEDTENSENMQQRIHELELQVNVLQKNIAALEAENQKFCDENKKLKATNEALYELSRQEKQDKERKRVEKTQPALDNLENLSPTQSLHSSFSDLTQFYQSENSSQRNSINGSEADHKSSFLSKLFK